MHIQSINTEIVSRQFQTFKDLRQSQVLFISKNDNILKGYLTKNIRQDSF